MSTMFGIHLLVKLTLLVFTAKCHVLYADSTCSTGDGERGVCTPSEECAARGGTSARRRSRRFSCSANMVCCPYNGGRRRSSAHKMVFKKNIKTNKQCAATVTAKPPAPESGCCGRDVGIFDRIIGGRSTSLKKFPWMAILEYKDGGGRKTDQLCVGSLISSRYILTAKHCVTGAAEATPTAVRLGEYDRRTKTDCVKTASGVMECIRSILISVETITLHPTKDIGIIRLASPAPYTDTIRPICLPEADITAPAPQGLEFVVAGWGLTETQPPRQSPVKLQTRVPYVPMEKCQQIYGDFRKLHAKEQICAGGLPGHDSCGGDSGGPLMRDTGDFQELSGVINFGSAKCGSGGIPAVHANVYEAKQWILDNIYE